MKSKGMREHKEEFIKLYREGHSFNTISKIYGIASCTVKRYVREDVPVPEKKDGESESDLIYQMYKNGVNMSKISTDLGLHKSTIKKILIKNHNVVFELNSSRYKYAHLSKNFKEDYESGQVISKIAEKYNVSLQTVLNYLRLEGVDTRGYDISNRVYNLREDYFNKMSDKKARVLGMLLSFSTTRYKEPNSYVVDVSIHQSKKKCLDEILEELYDGEHPSTPMSDLNYGLRIHGKTFYNTLTYFGLRQNVFPRIEEKYYKSFFEGVLLSSLSVSMSGLTIKHNLNGNFIKMYLIVYLNVDENSVRILNSSSVSIKNKEGILKIINEYPFVIDRVREKINGSNNKGHIWEMILDGRKK